MLLDPGSLLCEALQVDTLEVQRIKALIREGEVRPPCLMPFSNCSICVLLLKSLHDMLFSPYWPAQRLSA